MPKKKGLNDKQFIAIALIIIISGIAILGHDYFLSKKNSVYEEMSILLSQEPEEVQPVIDQGSGNGRNATRVSGDTSGRVKRETNVTYKYVGRLKIPKIGLNKGFVGLGKRGNNVDQNIAIMSGSKMPNRKNSHLIIAAHNGSGWNAFFTKVDRLKINDKAYITYKGKKYTYKLKRIRKDRKGDGEISIASNTGKKMLTLVTCARPDYKRYYLVLTFELVSETTIQSSITTNTNTNTNTNNNNTNNNSNSNSNNNSNRNSNTNSTPPIINNLN